MQQNIFHFPFSILHLQGAVYPSEQDSTPIAELATRLLLKPNVTRVSCGRTANNTYRIEWRDAYVSRTSNETIDASIELFRNGDVIVTENGVTTEIPYEIPFDHDGYGQDEDWVRSNFARLQKLSPSLTNAEEILSVGYVNWVDVQVGVGLTNGLYKLTATFVEEPPEIIHLAVGDCSVAVSEAGTYTFLLEKGPEYPVDLEPYVDGVVWTMDDDLADGAEALASAGDNHDVVDWSPDGGWRIEDPPGRGSSGRFAWYPILRGSPACPRRLMPSDFPRRFEAVMADYRHQNDLVVEWHSSDGISLSSDSGWETFANLDSDADWGYFQVSASVCVNGHYLSTCLSDCIFDTSPIETRLSLSAPEVVFIRNGNRSERYYKVNVYLLSPQPTNGTLTVTLDGTSGPCAYETAGGECPMNLSSLAVSNPGNCVERVAEFYLTAEKHGCGTIRCVCTLPDGTDLTRESEFRVIEPIQQLMTSERDPDTMGIVNPSRLVYGDPATLKVSVVGDFAASEVNWMAWGPADLTVIDGWRARVEATAEEGEVVVEARFGADSAVHPRFVLPIVRQRVIPVKAFVVEPPLGDPTEAWSDDQIEEQIGFANLIFRQVGIRFDLMSTTRNIGSDDDWSFDPDFSIPFVEGSFSSIRARSLMNTYQDNDCVEVYFVGVFQDSRAVAVTSDSGILMSLKANRNCLAHELGHALGLSDIYNGGYDSEGSFVPMRDYQKPVSRDMTEDTYRDWIDGSDCGFYPRMTVLGDAVRSLIMCGYSSKDPASARDIPSGRIKGARLPSASADSLPFVSVGADGIYQTDEEVFSK